MRFKFFIALCVVLLLGGQAFATTDNYDELIKNKVTIMVDGVEFNTYDEKQKIDLPAFIYENRTLLPLRKTFSVFNVEPKWDSKTRSISAEYKGNKIWLQVDNPIIKINDVEKEIDVPAKIFNNRTYVPIRKIFEAMDMEVEWDNVNRRVIISTGQKLSIDPFNFTISHNSSFDFQEVVKLNDNTVEINSISNPSQNIVVFQYDKDIDETLKLVRKEKPSLEYSQLRFKQNEKIYYSEMKNDFNDNIQRIVLTQKDDKTFLWYFNKISYDECVEIVNSIY